MRSCRTPFFAVIVALVLSCFLGIAAAETPAAPAPAAQPKETDDAR